MIEKFTANIPYRLSQQLLYEYNNRINDVNHFLSGKYDFYSPLKKDKETIELLLALSIFYKRVLTNFDSATKFSGRVVFNSDAESIQLGTYLLDKKEVFRIKRTILKFNNLMSKYSIPEYLFEYTETKEFLRKVRNYKFELSENDNG